MKKLVSTALLASLLAQLAAPLASSPAFADNGNPFGKMKPTVGCPPIQEPVKGTTKGAMKGALSPAKGTLTPQTAPWRPTPLAPPAEPEVNLCAPEPDLALANLPPFERLVRDYITAFYAGNLSETKLYAGKIKLTVFKSPGSPEYIENIRYLDTQTAHAPEAIFDIAKNIQLHWEGLYAMGMSKRDMAELNRVPIQNRTKDSNGNERTPTVDELKKQAQAKAIKIGAMVGIAVLGASLALKPSSTPRYFSLFRHLAPFAGVALGTGVGRTLTASGYYEKDLPISPASLMSLGISSEELAYDDHSLERDLAALTISMASFSIATKVIQAARVAKFANTAATPAKVNPVVLVASIAIGLAVEQGVEAGAEAWEFSNLKSHQNDARQAMDAAIARGDEYEAYIQAQALMKRTVNLAAFVNQPLTESMRDYVTAQESIGQQYAPDSPKYREEMNTLTRETSQKIRNHIESLEAQADPDRNTALVLSYLRYQDTSDIQLLLPHAREQAESYLRRFPAWLAQAERQLARSLTEGDRERLFKKYISELSSEYHHRLAQSLRTGAVRHDANHILQQASGYILATGKSFVSDQADFMRALIARNERMIAVFMSDAAAVAGIADQDQTMMEGGLPPGGVPTPSTRPESRGQNPGPNHNELDGGTTP